MKVSIIPFRAKHLLEIDSAITAEMFALGKMAEHCGSAYTAVVCGDPIGSAGIAIVQPGIGEAWSLLNPVFKRFPVSLHKAASRLIPEVMERHKLRRVQATIDPGDAMAIRWAERLGFEREGLMRQFGADGADLFLYAKVAAR